MVSASQFHRDALWAFRAANYNKSVIQPYVDFLQIDLHRLLSGTKPWDFTTTNKLQWIWDVLARTQAKSAPKYAPKYKYSEGQSTDDIIEEFQTATQSPKTKQELEEAARRALEEQFDARHPHKQTPEEKFQKETLGAPFLKFNPEPAREFFSRLHGVLQPKADTPASRSLEKSYFNQGDIFRSVQAGAQILGGALHREVRPPTTNQQYQSIYRHPTAQQPSGPIPPDRVIHDKPGRGKGFTEIFSDPRYYKNYRHYYRRRRYNPYY